MRNPKSSPIRTEKIERRHFGGSSSLSHNNINNHPLSVLN